MSKVLTFSRTFPAYHSRKGEDTFFVEKILNVVMPKKENGIIDIDYLPKEVQAITNEFFMLMPNGEHYKSHTIRAGNRWKVGDKFSPRVWSGKPYQSKQIVIAPDIEVKKVWDIKSDGILWWVEYQPANTELVTKISLNDGLEYCDFLDWFKVGKAFSGQIICWNEAIDY